MRFALAPVVLLTMTYFAIACGTSSDSSPDESDESSDGGKSNADGGTSFGNTSDAAQTSDDECAGEAKSIYVLDYDASLHRFDPSTLSFTTIGPLDCPTTNGDTTFSMAVDRSGTAWVLFASGNLFKVSTKDASCSATAFKANQGYFRTFGMGFATDSEDSKTDTLYVASADYFRLGKIDFTTMTVTDIGGLGLPVHVELTGTGSGQLFGLIQGSGATPWKIAEFDKTTGANLLTKSQTEIPRGLANFAFAAWDGNFFSFVGSQVFRYKPSTNENTVAVDKVPFLVVGAGVSTCAPHAVVK